MSAHPLDLPAMAAWGAFYGIDAGTVAEDWPKITPRTRENWRAAVDAAISISALAAQEQPAPGSAEVAAWIQDNPREFAAWVDAQRRIGGPAPGATEPGVHLVQLRLCDPCIDGEGGECHTPGCALWINRAPDLPLRRSPVVTVIAAAGQAAFEAWLEGEGYPADTGDRPEYSLGDLADAARRAFLAGIASAQPQPAPGSVTVNARDIAIALNGCGGFVGDPVSFAAELHERLRRTVFADPAPEPQPAPDPAEAMREAASRELAAAMAESRAYREALQIARSFLLDPEPSGRRRAIAAMSRALEGK